MEIKILVDRPLSLEEAFVIERFKVYTNQATPFVVLGGYTAMMPADKELQPQELVELAKKEMAVIANSHPDFASLPMKDGYALVRMTAAHEGVYAVSKETIAVKEGQIAVEQALAIRGYALDVCKRGEVVAVAMP